MIDYGKVKSGDKLRIVGMGAPGFAKLGDIVTVTKCSAQNNGRCDVTHDQTGAPAYFALTCGAQRLEQLSGQELEQLKQSVMESLASVNATS